MRVVFDRGSDELEGMWICKREAVEAAVHDCERRQWARSQKGRARIASIMSHRRTCDIGHRVSACPWPL